MSPDPTPIGRTGPIGQTGAGATGRPIGQTGPGYTCPIVLDPLVVLRPTNKVHSRRDVILFLSRLAVAIGLLLFLGAIWVPSNHEELISNLIFTGALFLTVGSLSWIWQSLDEL